ncbi:MAG: pseudouridylate synthase [Flavobacteriaceae bacterium]|nr:pseudouridylate synthase [Flavobacteriaceae bacterium]|tara:strand:- start:1068 stop:1781 length:714 start_codon:yes stop_codon:yes gene_type:complete
MSEKILVRLNKFISNSGICNRREADEYISQGRVSVNNKTIVRLGSKVSLSDSVKLDGRKVFPVKMQYIILNKPKGFHCIYSKTNSKTVFSILSSIKEENRVISLDFLKENYTGLMILSNDTEFISQINAKKNLINQIFHLKLDVDFLQRDLKRIKDLDVNNKLKIKSINYVDGANKNEIGIELSIHNIKDLEKLLLDFNYKIISLDRVLFSNFTKKDLSRGQWRNITKKELINLKSF